MKDPVPTVDATENQRVIGPVVELDVPPVWAIGHGHLTQVHRSSGRPHADHELEAQLPDVIQKDSGFHLLPIPYVSKLQDEYFPAVITSDDYPNMMTLGQEVETVAVGAVLAAYNWPEDTERYKRLEQFVQLFFKKFPEFQQAPRH